MIRVIVESPFAPRTPMPEGECPTVGSRNAWPCTASGCAYCKVRQQRAEESALHARYLAAALRDCVLRGETPYASHGLLTLPGVLRDDVPAERELGIRAGFAWREVAHSSVFYVNLGWSSGMKHGKEDAKKLIDMQRRDSNTPPTAVHKIERRLLGPDWDRK